jgi:hypothetical protein
MEGAMAEIQRITLERENDAGVHEIKDRTRLEPVDPAPPGSEKDRLEDEKLKKKQKEEFDRATTPFPGG